jgi:hypothetical protein
LPDDIVLKKGGTYTGCEYGFNNDYNYTLNANTSYLGSGDVYEVVEGQLKDPVEGNILQIKFYTRISGLVTLNLYGQTDDGSMLLKNYQMFQYANTDGTLNPVSDLDG